MRANISVPHDPTKTYTHRIVPLRILQAMCNNPDFYVLFYNDDMEGNEKLAVTTKLPMRDFTKEFRNYIVDPFDDSIPENYLERMYDVYIRTSQMLYNRKRGLHIMAGESLFSIPQTKLAEMIRLSLADTCTNPPIKRSLIIDPSSEIIDDCEKQWTE
jgi:hypothetical protein